jgi:2-dehydro-3-deoxy-D-arabinonate dehydratase
MNDTHTDDLMLFRAAEGPVVAAGGQCFRVTGISWDALFNDDDLHARLREAVDEGVATAPLRHEAALLPPIESQEVWAAGVTYLRSKSARMAEAEGAGGGNFYDRVYSAPRPEIFFKTTPHRVVGHGAAVRVRRDSVWSVPEPELVLAVNKSGRIVGYTIGNDMSARDIEGENPLYLPQAKTYDECFALGPGILVTSRPLPAETAIRLTIERDGAAAFEGSTTLAMMKRSLQELVSYLVVDNSFPAGCFLSTGTGIVPPDSFALRVADRIEIRIDGIGTLVNNVVQHRG